MKLRQQKVEVEVTDGLSKSLMAYYDTDFKTAIWIACYEFNNLYLRHGRSIRSVKATEKDRFTYSAPGGRMIFPDDWNILQQKEIIFNGHYLGQEI